RLSLRACRAPPWWACRVPARGARTPLLGSSTGASGPRLRSRPGRERRRKSRLSSEHHHAALTALPAEVEPVEVDPGRYWVPGLVGAMPDQLRSRPALDRRDLSAVDVEDPHRGPPHAVRWRADRETPAGFEVRGQTIWGLQLKKLLFYR